MTFVDASVLVAILTGEDDAAELVRRLDAASDPFTSPLAVFETALGVFRKNRKPMDLVSEQVAGLLSRANIRLVEITPAEADLALAAFARYGKGQGHPAQFNMGDCFAYAAARHHGAGLLFKGDDFAHTDIPVA